MSPKDVREQSVVDPRTGELVKGAQKFLDAALQKAPDFAKAKPIAEVVGPRPPLFNLRDHPEFSERAFTVVNVREAQGDFGFHLYLAGWLSKSTKPTDSPEPIVIRTGSEFILTRIVPAIPTINGGTAVTGILRNAGNAWLFEDK